jgi:hypothetical protein
VKPEFFLFTVDQTTDIGEWGHFTLIEHFEGQVKISVHTDQEGNFVMEVDHVRLRHTITKLALSFPERASFLPVLEELFST